MIHRVYEDILAKNKWLAEIEQYYYYWKLQIMYALTVLDGVPWYISHIWGFRESNILVKL